MSASSRGSRSAVALSALGGFVLGVVVSAPLLVYGVTVPNVFSNGEVIDAIDMNANFSALESGVNVNEARIGVLGGLKTVTASSLVEAVNEVKSVAEGVPQRSDRVLAFVEVPASGGSVDVRPPSGEVWFLEGTTAQPGEVTTFFTDGATEVTATASSTYIGNSLWLRVRGIGASAVPLFYAATKRRAEFVGFIDSVAGSGTADIRPPAGEVWQVALDPSLNPSITDGTSVVTMNDSYPIDNGHWMRFTNPTGSPLDYVVTGVKAP